jgi:hypothetical protein
MKAVASMWRQRGSGTMTGGKIGHKGSMTGGSTMTGGSSHRKKRIYSLAPDSPNTPPDETMRVQQYDYGRQNGRGVLEPATEVPEQTGGGFLGVPDNATDWEAFKYGLSLPFKAIPHVLPFLL